MHRIYVTLHILTNCKNEKIGIAVATLKSKKDGRRKRVKVLTQKSQTSEHESVDHERSEVERIREYRFLAIGN